MSTNENVMVSFGKYEIEQNEFEKLFGFQLDRTEAATGGVL